MVSPIIRRWALMASRTRPPSHSRPEIGMRHLPKGMNPGIGTTGTTDRDILAAEATDRLFNRALHAGPVRLPLPAGIGRAVIFDDEPVARHQGMMRPDRKPAAPRRNSAAGMGRLPARCTSQQAKRAFTTGDQPGLVEHGPRCAMAGLDRRAQHLHPASRPVPNRPRTRPRERARAHEWLRMETAGFDQSIRASSLLILAA